MFKTFNSKKLMFAALAVIPLISFFAMAIYAGGPENPTESSYKKGRIKGIVTAERDSNDGCVSISLVGKCNKKDSPEDKYIDIELCDCCWITSDENFAGETETSLLETVRSLETNLVPGCFEDEILGENEFLEITDVREFYNDGNTITTVCNVRAQQ